ncbi:MAG: DUF559 domain-containing protein [Afipia sp.]|nr:DUF559 domain-containing protein [Afipia sp.]
MRSWMRSWVFMFPREVLTSPRLRGEVPYIVDFVCRERRLVVEVDGGQHEANVRDAVRDRWLVGEGYRVLRFWNNDVLGNLPGVLETLAAALNGSQAPHPDR